MNVIVRLFANVKGFPAVRYNMDKVKEGVAELLMWKNFGILHAIREASASDFEQYFLAQASLNGISRYDQFHVALSVRGRSMSVNELKDFAQQWLMEMGYGEQPYLIFAHLDTSNTHVHIVTTGVRLDRSKLIRGLDRVKALAVVNKLLGKNPEEEFKRDISPLLEYTFSSLDQLTTLVKKKGYQSYTKAGTFFICKYGQPWLKISSEKIKAMILHPAAPWNQLADLRQVINDSLNIMDNSCYPVYQTLAGQVAKRITGFRSALSDHLLKVNQLEIVYHFKKREITAFTLIDHQHKMVVSGEEIMDLQRLISKKAQITGAYHLSR